MWRATYRGREIDVSQELVDDNQAHQHIRRWMQNIQIQDNLRGRRDMPNNDRLNYTASDTPTPTAPTVANWTAVPPTGYIPTTTTGMTTSQMQARYYGNSPVTMDDLSFDRTEPRSSMPKELQIFRAIFTMLHKRLLVSDKEYDYITKVLYDNKGFDNILTAIESLNKGEINS